MNTKWNVGERTQKIIQYSSLSTAGISFIVMILFIVELANPFSRLTISSPANVVFASFFLLYFSLLCSFHYKQYHPANPNVKSNFRGFTIIINQQLSIISAIAWLINPVYDWISSLLLFITFIVISLIAFLWIRDIANQNNKKMRQKLQLNKSDQTLTDLEQSQNKQTEVEQNKKCGLKKILKILNSILFVFVSFLLILYTLQVLLEATYPTDLGEGERFHKISSDGYEIQIRSYCTGKAESGYVLYEAGGGSCGIDFYQIQNSLKGYYVCTYDRAGYGKSWQAPSPVSNDQNLNIASQLLDQIMPNKQIICIGHSVGGQICQYYARKAKFVKAIIILDSVPVMKWYYQVGLKKNQNLDQVYNQQQSTIGLIKGIASLWPLYLGSLFIGSGNDYPVGVWQKWQIRTTRNWYAQSLGAQSESIECNKECMGSPVVSKENMVNVPLIAISASNDSISCQDRKLTGQQCEDYLINRDVTIQIIKDQVQLGTQPLSQFEQCEGICDHDFVWVKPAYLTGRIQYYLDLL